MLIADENRIKICMNCACIFESKGEKLLECPQCGYQIPIEEYHSILLNARESVLYGYYYRKSYEDQLRERGKIEEKGSILTFNEILNFIALAVLSDITNDVAKNVIKKIISQIDDRLVEISGSDKNQIKMIDDQKEMIAFEKYVSEFYYHLKEIEPEIRDAIVEEIIADMVSEVMAPKFEVGEILKSSYHPICEEEIEKNFQEAMNNLKNKKRIEDYTLDFWKDVEK